MIYAERPTAIIRTLPSLYGDASVGAQHYQRSIALLEAGKLRCVYIALACIPRIEVAYIYLLVNGHIDVRLNLAGFEPGTAQKCWDETIRAPKYWALCTAPVSRPPEPIKLRGFQGIRYTAGFW